MQALENDFCPGRTIIFSFSYWAYKLGDDEYSDTVFGIENCIWLFANISIHYFCKKKGGGG